MTAKIAAWQAAAGVQRRMQIPRTHNPYPEVSKEDTMGDQESTEVETAETEETTKDTTPEVFRTVTCDDALPKSKVVREVVKNSSRRGH
jgi:hypothetical protein